MHAATLDPALTGTEALVERAASLLRSGLPLTMARLAALAPDTLLDPGMLEPILSPGGQPRSALVRALEAAAALGAGPLADLVPAMLLGSAGMLHRLHFLPFVESDPAARGEAVAASGDDDGLALARLLLGVAAESARVRRMAIESGLAHVGDGADRLAPLGRAAITARRALAVLRDALAATMPSLSATLDCSRPAAGDALDRLVEVGLAREITGRGRDRVYVDAMAWDVPPS